MRGVHGSYPFIRLGLAIYTLELELGLCDFKNKLGLSDGSAAGSQFDIYHP